MYTHADRARDIRIERMLALISEKETRIMSQLSDAVTRIAADIKSAVQIITDDAATEADNADAVSKLNAAADALEAAAPAIHAANPSAPPPPAAPAA